MANFEKVAILGFGTRGAGIAETVAASGRSVIVLENDHERVKTGMSSVEKSLSERGELCEDSETSVQEVLTRISVTADVQELDYVDLVIEAVTEDKETKAVLLSQLAEVVSAQAVIATSTSSLSVSELASGISNPQRFAGLHFFNPGAQTKIVEVVRGLETSDEVLDQLQDFVRSLGKEPIPVKDRPGFLLNALLMPYLNDVVQELDNGLATAEDMDTAIRLGLGYKRGPLELLDMIGLDVHQHTTLSVYDATLDSAYAAPPLLRTMVAAGMQGNKNERGFRSEEVR